MTYRTDGSDGGPAFPHQDSGDAGTRPGMTLRDWFAGQIAAQMVRRCVSLEDWGRLPFTAYELADAMLEARK